MLKLINTCLHDFKALSISMSLCTENVSIQVEFKVTRTFSASLLESFNQYGCLVHKAVSFRCTTVGFCLNKIQDIMMLPISLENEKKKYISTHNLNLTFNQLEHKIFNIKRSYFDLQTPR